jgi:hypothetical protein
MYDLETTHLKRAREELRRIPASAQILLTGETIRRASAFVFYNVFSGVHKNMMRPEGFAVDTSRATPTHPFLSSVVECVYVLKYI